MPKFVIERDMPEVGKLSLQDLQGASKKSCTVLRSMGPHIQWLHSYVTQDKLYCIYIAPNVEAIKQHAEESGFPASRISEIKSIIDPTTAEG